MVTIDKLEVTTLYSKELAESMANTLNADKSDNWIYIATKCKESDRYYIKILDENRAEVGNL